MKRLAVFASGLGAAVAALATLAIMLIVLTQVTCRLLGIITQGLDEVVAWLTAAACVAGFGYAFQHAAHVRVELLTDMLPTRSRRLARIASLLAALAIAGFAAYACMHMAYQSYAYHDVAQGVIALPLWLPQLSVVLGTVSLALSVLDALVAELRGKFAAAAVRRPVHEVAEI